MKHIREITELTAFHGWLEHKITCDSHGCTQWSSGVTPSGGFIKFGGFATVDTKDYCESCYLRSKGFSV